MYYNNMATCEMFVVSVTRITISDHPPSKRVRAKDANKTHIIIMTYT